MAIVVAAFCTRNALPELTFPHQLGQTGNRSMAGFVSHLNRCADTAFARGGKRWTATTFEVAQHFMRTKHFLELTFERDALGQFSSWAYEANAIVMSHAGAICDPLGRVLVGLSGERDSAAQVPYPPEAWARKARTEELLKRRGIPLLSQLPPVVGDSEAVMREPREVAERALAAFIVAHRLTSAAEGDPISFSELGSAWPSGMLALSAREKVALGLEEGDKTRQSITPAVATGAAQALFWALGVAGQQSFAVEAAKLTTLSEFLSATTEMAFIEGARLRQTTTLLDELDFQYRVNAAQRQATLNSRPLRPLVDETVVQERHRALNWISLYTDAGWDEVQTNT
ncbi:MAG TPA: DUF4272 domain-containing protein [Stellaceae bacterium]|nr:DUF4272 domain-containing protein [Stellaceae bacterium]